MQIKNNEIVDKLAKAATLKANPDIEIPLKLKEAYLLADDHTKKKWQMKWFHEPKGRAYFGIQNSLSNKIKYTGKHIGIWKQQ